MTTGDIKSLHDSYAHLYIGDYFVDTLELSANEHRALRLLLLETWLSGPVGHSRLAKIAGVTEEEWRLIKPAIMPLLRGVQPRIAQSLRNIRRFDGRRLPAEDWQIIRAIVFERDGYACFYCGADKKLEGDHIIPLSRGGSNVPANIATACRACNLSKGTKSLEEWQANLASTDNTDEGGYNTRSCPLELICDHSALNSTGASIQTREETMDKENKDFPDTDVNDAQKRRNPDQGPTGLDQYVYPE